MKILYLGILAYVVIVQLKSWFLTMHRTKLGKPTKKMSDDSDNIYFSGVRFICNPYLATKSVLVLFR